MLKTHIKVQTYSNSIPVLNLRQQRTKISQLKTKWTWYTEMSTPRVCICDNNNCNLTFSFLNKKVVHHKNRISLQLCQQNSILTLTCLRNLKSRVNPLLLLALDHSWMWIVLGVQKELSIILQFLRKSNKSWIDLWMMILQILIVMITIVWSWTLKVKT